jgi:hypothetical protein
MTLPAHKPTAETREKVSRYTAVGIPQEDIAKVLKIDSKTLRKHYRDELDTAATISNAEIGGALYTKAMKGDTTAMIWWTKTRMRWKEVTGVEHSGQMNLEVAGDLLYKKNGSQ